jgi:hypothetical protein
MTQERKAAAIPETPIDVRQDGLADERPWVKPGIAAEDVARQLAQQTVLHGEVGFNPMARDPVTGELLHPWPPKDDGHEGSTAD